MRNSKDIEQVARELEASPRTSPTAAGQTDTAHRPEPAAEQVDAINQVFALFRLNYHNQYYSAWGNDEQLAQIKKFWLDALSSYSVSQILRAARHCVEASEYLPTLNRMLEACRHEVTALGIPDPRSAYQEACNAGTPRAAQPWSHPIVYFAGRDCGWFFLSNNPESVTLPVFKQHFNAYCDRVLAGESFAIEAPPVLEQATSAVLSREEQQEKLRALREELDL